MDNSGQRYIQIYTGNGKGKTTAAIGQAIRAAGHCLKTLIVMFMKNHPYGEVAALSRFGDLITVKQYGDDAFVFRKEPPGPDDLAAARKALERVRQGMMSGDYDIIIMDEVCVSVYFKLLTPEDVLPLLKEKPDSVELILTGRYCPEAWIELADLVTEMHETKHYYQRGIISRRGFES